jgi:predicted Zn-ribbon and HTH transcriptional regulator
MSLPALFMGIAGVMATLALLALWQSVRSALGAGPMPGTVGDATLPGRAALLDEKDALLRSIKDLAFEREVGKISDEDFRRLDADYRARAREVLRALDADLAPFEEKAKGLVADALGEVEGLPSAPPEAETPPLDDPGEGLEAASRCPRCEAPNKPHARFCKSCGASFEEATAAPARPTCAACGAENDADARFCDSCGETLGAPGPSGTDAEGTA